MNFTRKCQDTYDSSNATEARCISVTVHATA